jgi:hypothetical protein
MKKSLVLLSVIALAIACRKDMPAEEPFIETGGGGEQKKENPYWDWADKFPGPVSANIERVADFEVTVEGGYQPIAYAPDSALLQSTGLFAPSDGNIEIVVPEGVVDLCWQIGMGYTLAPGQLRKRYGNIVSRGTLHAGSNSVSSYFGGFLYFCYPAGSVPAHDVTVKVTGAVQSDDYIYGQTDAREWLTRMLSRAEIIALGSEDKDSTAFLNWCELRSLKVICTMGVPEMAAMTNPQSVLDHMGNIADSYLLFGGYDPAGQPPMRIYTDIQLPDPAQTPAVQAANIFRYGGYPTGCVRGETPTAFVDEKRILSPDLLKAQNDPAYGNWYALLYGFGEAVQSPWQRSPLLWQTSLQIGYYHYARTIGLWPGKVINFANHVASLNAYYDVEATNENNGDMYRSLSDDVRTTMLIQLTNHLGWGLFPYVSSRARELGLTYVEDPFLKGQEACDFFAMSACEYADEDLSPFFKKWRFPITAEAVRYAELFPAVSENFWENYNPVYIPVFDPRTPNKSLARPQGRLHFTMHNDTKDTWLIEGTRWNIYDYRQGMLTAVNSNDSDSNAEWRKAFDNDGTNNDQHRTGLLGHLQTAQHSLDAHIAEYTLSFRTDAPLKINTWAYWQPQLYYYANHVYDIRYWDENALEWKPTVPDRFKQDLTNSYEFYYFDESFTTSKIKFKILPRIVGAVTGYITAQCCELGVGYTEYK